MSAQLSPQDQAINRHIPLSFYAVHEIEGVLYGHRVDWKPAWEAEKDYEVVFHFNGENAHYWIGTNDRSIVRNDALNFALAVHKNRIRRFHCDLSVIGR